MKWFPNYVYDCCLIQIFVHSNCGNLSLSTASSSFRSHFVKDYVTGVQWRNRPHGQATSDMYMERVPSIQPNSLINGHGQRRSKEGPNKEFCGGTTLFCPREGLRGMILNFRRCWHTYRSTCELNRATTTPWI